MDRIQIRYEAHEEGGSAWVSGDGEWYCVWSTSPGNVGETLPAVDDTDELLHNSYLVAAIPLPPTCSFRTLLGHRWRSNLFDNWK